MLNDVLFQDKIVKPFEIERPFFDTIIVLVEDVYTSAFPAPDNAFPFLEADIVLDDDFHFIHRDVFTKQMEMRGRHLDNPHKQHGGAGTPASGGRGRPATGANGRRGRPKRATVKRVSKLWPDGVVPYYVDKNLGQ